MTLRLSEKGSLARAKDMRADLLGVCCRSRSLVDQNIRILDMLSSAHGVRSASQHSHSSSRHIRADHLPGMDLPPTPIWPYRQQWKSKKGNSSCST